MSTKLNEKHTIKTGYFEEWIHYCDSVFLW